MSQPAADTLLSPESPIVRPDKADHFMHVDRVEGAIVARIGDRVLARSTQALRVREVAGARALDPVVYFPPEDVDAAALVPTNVTTTCPLKGHAAAFDIAGEPPIERGAWSYQQTYDFDARLSQLECCVAFDRASVVVEAEA